jgi:crotonobetainyl-CoA:carnitine CoA-transferase CaiB-like acyl-CoA transferase
VPELAEAPEYLTNADRIARRAELTAKLSLRTRDWKKIDLLAACEAEGVPAGQINDMAEVFADPQVVARGMQIDAGGVPGVRAPFRFSGADLALGRSSPRLGEDDAAIKASRQ